MEHVNILHMKISMDLCRQSKIWDSESYPRPIFASHINKSHFVILYKYSWERRVDQLGRTYYVDHNNRQTTWTRPR